MIIEGLVTSIDSEGRVNLAPMGPIVRGDFESLVLRPFQPSTTFNNLASMRCGVFHVVDHVDVIAKAAIGMLTEFPETEPASTVRGVVLKNCCRWFEFTVDSVDATDARSVMPSTIVHRGERRPSVGFNRARHAVLEAAILATRLHLIPAQEIQSAVEFLEPAVQKTGDALEKQSFQMLKDYMARSGSLQP